MVPVGGVRARGDVPAQRERAERVVARHAVEARDDLRRLRVDRVLTVFLLLLHFKAYKQV